ncbi:hypothetical protein [Bacillus sp. SD075]|uniref:hypothetical protein n=1 Tax=Bacillus sp. SD075 TaxID=2781732 RepID=UPI001A96999E|nr:hypothetical protein [Bacillus sp. SD075]
MNILRFGKYKGLRRWNVQTALNNNLKASDLNPDVADKAKMGSQTIVGDQLNDLKIQREIRKQNI